MTKHGDHPAWTGRAGTAAGPLTRLPQRGHGSVRRTATLDAAPDGSWEAGWILTGIARDLLTDHDGGSHVLAQVEISARIGARGELRELDIPTSPEVVGGLLGRDARRGFRAALMNLPASLRASLEGALLDDLPGLGIVSGYARLRAGRIAASSAGAGNRHPQIGTCAGWAPGGSAARLVAEHDIADPSRLRDRPAAIPLAEMTDPAGWHEEPPIRPGAVRRRRLLEVALGEDGPIYGYFRDSYGEPEGGESALHEYELHALARGTPPVLASVRAVPRPLPFAECPLAAENVVRLEGVALAEIDRAVRTTLTGVDGCTHLNDLLRTLRFVEPLRRTVASQRGVGRTANGPAPAPPPDGRYPGRGSADG